jgi:hypothetical protein
MTPDGSIHVLIRELRTLANGFSARDQDVSAAHVWNSILSLRKALSPEAQAEADALDRKRLEALRA